MWSKAARVDKQLREECRDQIAAVRADDTDSLNKLFRIKMETAQKPRITQDALAVPGRDDQEG